MTKLTTLFLVAGLGSVAHANGFLLNEFDAKAVGRGDATTATSNDPSSIYYNVGGLGAADGTQVMIGGSAILPRATYTDPAGQKTDSTTSPQFVPGLFASSRVHSMVTVGVGFYTPFGLAVDWPANNPNADVVQNIALHTFFITPSVGVNLGSYLPGLTVGGGIDLVPATIELRQAVPFGADPAGSAHLAASAFGIGGRIGAMYRPASQPKLSIGAMWRSTVTEDFSGDANFDASPEYRQMLPADGSAKATAKLPQSVSAGAAYRPMEGLEVEANVVWTNWSQFKNLDLTVLNPAGNGTVVIKQPQNYENTWTARVGGEYKLPNLGAAVRAGFIYDPTPIPSTTLNAQLPDVNRYNITFGGSKTFGDYAGHVGFLWVLPNSNTTSNQLYMPVHKGTFDVQAFVVSLTLQGTLGK